MKKFLALTMAALMMMSVLAGCGSSTTTTTDDADTSETTEATYVWKMALNSTEGDNAYDTGAAFKEKIEELTNGQVTIELYGGAALGTTAEVLEGMSYGVADIMVESIGTLSSYTTLANIEAAPFLINDYDHFVAVWQGEVGELIKDAVGEAAGFKLLGGTYRGPRIVTATTAMYTVEDFQGFKLRSPNLEMYLATWNWLNAAPTPLAVGETYTALQQGTVTGQENPMVDSINYSFDEVCDYWIKTNHVYGVNVVIMEQSYFESLPEDIQAAVEEAANYAAEVVGAAQLVKEQEAEEYLIAEGKTIIEIDRDEFVAYFEDFIAEQFPELVEWAEMIKAAAN